MITPSKLWPHAVVGDKKTAPTVFLHGFMGSRRDWLPIVQRLNSSLYSIIPDLPGHGQNIPENYDQPLSFDKLAQELSALLDHLEINTVNLVGYSMGGRLGLYFSLHYPNRVHRLVLESASAGIVSEADRRERQLVDTERADRILEQGMERFVEGWYEMPLFRSLKSIPDFKELKESRETNDPIWMANVVRDLSPGRQPQLWDQLQLLEMPVLLIAGEFDNKYIDSLQTMADSIKDCKIATILGSGHICHYEQPERFLHQLQPFLGVANE